MSEQPAEPLQIFPPGWFVENFNAGVARDWRGEGMPPYRGPSDPLVMYTWYLATRPLPVSLCRLTSIA